MRKDWKSSIWKAIRNLSASFATRQCFPMGTYWFRKTSSFVCLFNFPMETLLILNRLWVSLKSFRCVFLFRSLVKKMCQVWAGSRLSADGQSIILGHKWLNIECKTAANRLTIDCRYVTNHLSVWAATRSLRWLKPIRLEWLTAKVSQSINQSTSTRASNNVEQRIRSALL